MANNTFPVAGYNFTPEDELLLDANIWLFVVVETKAQEDLDVPLKTHRLRQWCEDINATQSDVAYDFVYVDQEGFEKYAPKSFADVLTGFREYKE